LLIAVFLLTVVLERGLVPRLRRYAAQPILEIGPHWHLSKRGTPTLGGLGFILAILIVALFFLPMWRVNGQAVWGRMLFLVGFGVSCGLVGLIDDRCKLLKKENKGLSAKQKYLLQLAICAVFLWLAGSFFGLSTAIPVPFVGKTIDLDWLYYPFALVYLTGVVNALNLTDGVDGLLSSLVGVFGGFLLFVGVLTGEQTGFICGCMLFGAVLGFLCFNAHPAKIFMGDTGSLFLGGMVAGYGILSPSPLTVLIACGVFVLEAFSVILQVVYFKLSHGKRILRMAPLHHHFEKGGWSEERVVLVFVALGVIFALLAVLGG
jgi:phospho-N-acetylmuramoyl-pentapeptide-transferase